MRLRQILRLTTIFGVIFTSAFVLVLFCYCSTGGKTDPVGVASFSIMAIFSIQLLVGSILVMCRKKAGLPLLKFGSPFVFLGSPRAASAIWKLESNPEFHAYLQRKSPKRDTLHPRG